MKRSVKNALFALALIVSVCFAQQTLSQYILTVFVSPEGVYSARRGSIALDPTNGFLWVKGTGNGNTGWLRVLALDFSGLTASRPLKLDASKNIISTKIDPTVANDFEVSGLTNGALIKRSGSALASATSPLPLSDGGTAGTTAATARTSLDVYSKAEVDALIAGANATALSYVQSIGVNFSAIDYKDHSNVNQSKSFVDGITLP